MCPWQDRVEDTPCDADDPQATKTGAFIHIDISPIPYCIRKRKSVCVGGFSRAQKTMPSDLIAATLIAYP